MAGELRFCSETDRAAFRVTGSDRLEYLERMLSRRFVDRPGGDAVHALLLDRKGHVLASLAAYLGEADVLCVTDAAAVPEAVMTLQRSVLRSDVQIDPQAVRVVAVLGEGADPDAVARWFGPCDRIARSPQGEGWVEIVGDPEATTPTAEFQGELHEGGADTFERWCIAHGIPRHGRELTGRELPQEARLEDAIDFDKGCYPGQETVARIHYRGHVNRLLVGLRSEGPLRPGLELRDAERVVGAVTSALDEGDGGWIGLGYVARSHAQGGGELVAGSGLLVRTVGLPGGGDAGQHSER